MITKKITSIFLLGVALIIFWYIQNAGLPLGFDHGAYKHFINLLAENNTLDEIPHYLTYQFEPFSGTFFYSLTAIIGQEIVFSWGYLSIFILTGVSLFLLGKKKKKYTIGSYFGLFLFFFSAIQYMNLWWAFGKQMFATFFLILLMRYYKNSLVAFVLMTACLSLHRLTGFVALLYFVFSYLLLDRKNLKHYYALLLGLGVAVLSYISSFYEQIFSFLKNFITNPGNQIFISGKYGTGFNSGELFYYLVPISLMVFLGFAYRFQDKNLNGIFRKPHILCLIVVALMVLLRSVAHTRLGTFLDLFLIITITRSLYHVLEKKWIYTFMIIQCVTWGVFANKWHTPFIDKTEYQIIQDITKNTPEDVTLVTLSGAYMSWMSGHTEKEIYSLYQGISSEIWSQKDKYLMRYYPWTLCHNLGKLDGNIFIFQGRKDAFPSLENNTCLEKVLQWRNGSALLLYQR